MRESETARAKESATRPHPSKLVERMKKRTRIRGGSTIHIRLRKGNLTKRALEGGQRGWAGYRRERDDCMYYVECNVGIRIAVRGMVRLVWGDGWMEWMIAMYD